MARKPGITAVSLLIGLLLFPSFAPGLEAQTAPPPPAQPAALPPPTPQQLDQLLAPVALYPDSLLAQITTASTNPRRFSTSTTGLPTIRVSLGPRSQMQPSNRDLIPHSSRWLIFRLSSK